MSCESQQKELQQTNAELEDKASLLAAPEPRDRDQEPRDRGRSPGPRGPCRAAGPVVEVQVGVPREHVTRTQDAPEFVAHPRQAARREQRGEPQLPPGRVLPHDPHSGHRPAPADQRHPRPVQGRGRQDGRAPRRRGALRDRRVRRCHVPAPDGGEGPALLRVHVRGRGPDPLLRPAPSAAGAAEPAVQRGEVHLVGRGTHGDPCCHGARALRLAVPDARRPGDRLLRHGHRDRHPARAAQGDLRGLPAGGRHDQPEVRRHRARPLDQPGDRRAHRRRDPRGERARQGQHLHPLHPPASTRPSPP